MNNREQSWALGSMIALDLESTDTDPNWDRIVTAAVVAITVRTPGVKPEVSTRDWLADPGVAIPAEATAIHGVTTEHARLEARPAADVVAEVAEHLAEVWTPGTPLCAFNASFDLTMLNAELRRHHGRSLPLGGPVIDPLCIDRHLRPVRGWQDRRRLVDVCAHYDVTLEGAHTSDGDAIATARLAYMLAKLHPAKVGLLDPQVLHSRQAGWFREQENAYAARQEWKLQQRLARDSDSEQTDRLRDRIAGIRARAKSWPLLPDPGVEVPPTRRRLPPRPGGPANSHASWTEDLEDTLRRVWLEADPTDHAETLRRSCPPTSDGHRSPSAHGCSSCGAIPNCWAAPATSSAPPSSSGSTTPSSGETDRDGPAAAPCPSPDRVIGMGRRVPGPLRCLMILGLVPGGNGRPELHGVGSAGGSSTHLFDPVAERALCSGLRSGKVVIGPGVMDFAVLGCRRCAAEAVHRGYEVFFDHDGAAVRFADFEPIS